mmetsp:Transcript_12838/g.21725  ORF Transcript_12838/g.21725 Transcript_12838/m.21725 type:complete len:135 (+) Transcript_12838:48-452(+)
MDRHLSAKAVVKRRETGEMMDRIYPKLMAFINRTEYPLFFNEEIRALGINGCTLQSGPLAFNLFEYGALIYEIAKRDYSVGLCFFVQNSLGVDLINQLGSQEQKDRILPGLINYDKMISFGLTEEDNGSDASSL